MKIETKYNFGQEVWYLHYHSSLYRDVPRKGTINIIILQPGFKSPRYELHEDRNEGWIREIDLYDSEDNAINAIEKQMRGGYTQGI